MPAIPIIFDTDFTADCDDSGGLAMLVGFINSGEATLIAAGTPVSENNAAPTLQAFLAYYGLSVPIGTWKGATSLGPTTPSVETYGGVSTIYANALGANGGGSAADILTVYRTALSAAANGSVVILAQGPATGLKGLLASAADGIDSRNGIALVTAKVSRLVWLAGDYVGGPPLTGTEYNMTTDAVAANYVGNNWPIAVPIRFLGVSSGNGMLSGGDVRDYRWNGDVTKYIYANDANAVSGTRDSWGPLATLLAVRGLTSGATTVFNESAAGKNNVNSSTGVNTWDATTNANQTYCTLHNSQSLTLALIDPLMSRAVQVPQLTPVAFWDFHESSGTTVGDIVGGHTGTLTGSPTPTINGDYFDNTASGTGHMEANDAADLKFTAAQSFTVVTQFNFPSSLGSGFRALVSKSRDVEPHYYLGFNTTGSGDLFFGTYGGGSFPSASTTFVPSTGTWYTGYGGQDASANKLFCGRADAVSEVTGGSATDVNGTGKFVIGGALSVSEYSHARQDNVRIFASRLNAFQMSQVHFEPLYASTNSAGTQISLTMGQQFATNYTTDSTGWEVTANGLAVSVSSASASGRTITLVLGSSIGSGKTVKLSYFNGGTVDVNSQKLYNFGAFPVTNNSTILPASPLGAFGSIFGNFLQVCGP